MKTRSALPIGAVLLGWAGLTIGAFWHLEWQYMRPVSRPSGGIAAHPEMLPSSPVPLLPTDQGDIRLDQPGQVTWLNVWNPECPCSRYAEAQVQRLAAKFAGQGVRLITLVECGAAVQEQRDALATWHKRNGSSFAAAADPASRLACRFGVWAAPAAVILDRQGRVAYVGAYNAARYCDNPVTAWAAQALESITQDRRPLRPSTPFYGCQVSAVPTNRP